MYTYEYIITKHLKKPNPIALKSTLKIWKCFFNISPNGILLRNSHMKIYLESNDFGK